MKKGTRKVAILGAMLFTLSIPVSAGVNTGYYNNHKYTVTATRNGSKAYGSIDYEATSSFTPAVAIWGTRAGANGARVNYPSQWGTFSVTSTNPDGGNIITVNAQGFIDGTSVGIATAG